MDTSNALPPEYERVGFTRRDQDGRLFNLYACHRCAAVVTDPTTHAEWHMEQAKHFDGGDDRGA